jgi:hypothetical protein
MAALHNTVVSLLRCAGFSTIAARMRYNSIHPEAALQVLSCSLFRTHKLCEEGTSRGFLNLQEGWWRLFRRDARASQSFANPKEIEQATRVVTTQLNLRAKPWVWGRPPKTSRCRCRLFCYRI